MSKIVYIDWTDFFVVLLLLSMSFLGGAGERVHRRCWWPTAGARVVGALRPPLVGDGTSDWKWLFPEV